MLVMRLVYIYILFEEYQIILKASDKYKLYEIKFLNNLYESIAICYPKHLLRVKYIVLNIINISRDEMKRECGIGEREKTRMTLVMICFFLIILSFTIHAEAIQGSLRTTSFYGTMFAKTPAPTQETTYDLLIIAPPKFVNALDPLIDHKNAVGIATRLVTLDEIYDEMYWTCG